MQETLDTMISEFQSVAIKIISTICDITDVSIKLNKDISEISLELILSFMLCISLDMEKNSSTWLNKVDSYDSPISNLKLK